LNVPVSLTGTILLFVVRLIQIYNWLILARVLASWIVQNPNNQIYHFLYSVTEPILGRIRRVIPPMGLDISPIIAYFLLSLAAQLLISLI